MQIYSDNQSGVHMNTDRSLLVVIRLVHTSKEFDSFNGSNDEKSFLSVQLYSNSDYEADVD